MSVPPEDVTGDACTLSCGLCGATVHEAGAHHHRCDWRPQLAEAHDTAKLADVRACNALDRIGKVEKALLDRPTISPTEMYQDAERRCAYWHRKYDARMVELDKMRDVVAAARTFVRGIQTGADAAERKRKVRAAVRAYDAAVRSRTP